MHRSLQSQGVAWIPGENLPSEEKHVVCAKFQIQEQSSVPSVYVIPGE